VVSGRSSSNSTQVVVPPQILLQMLYGEAHGQAAIGDSVSQLAAGVTARNRFSQPGWFSGVTTYQDAITGSQFESIRTCLAQNNCIPNGPTPDIDNAAAVFAGTTTVSAANAGCFFSPSHEAWLTIQAQLQSPNAVLTRVPNDTGCYGNRMQYVVKQSVGSNADGRGAPAFIFVQERDPSSSPAVIEIP
jgi:hypothetical protein